MCHVCENTEQACEYPSRAMKPGPKIGTLLQTTTSTERGAKRMQGPPSGRRSAASDAARPSTNWNPRLHCAWSIWIFLRLDRVSISRIQAGALSARERMATGVFSIEGGLISAIQTRGGVTRGLTCMTCPSFSIHHTKRHRRIKSRLFHPRKFARARRTTLSFNRPSVPWGSPPP